MKKALVIGIDNYKDQPLHGCVNDATAIAEKLRTPGFGYDVDLLLDAAATRRDLRFAVQRTLQGAKTSLLYFAGHGWKTDITTYIATFDSEPGDEGIDFGYLTRAVSSLASPEQSVVIILDCCHAGDATARSASVIRNISREDIPALSGSGRVVIAACRGDEPALETKADGVIHGAFTVFLLEALSGHGADTNGYVTVSTCFEHAAKKLAEKGQQTPVLRGDQTGRIILGLCESRSAPAGQPDVPPSELRTKEILAEAQTHVESMFAAGKSYNHAEWLQRGHREACQKLVPLLDWFRRRLDDSPDLRSNSTFRECWQNISQQYQQLCNLTPGTVLDHGRRVGKLLGAGTFGSVWKISGGGLENICFKAYHANDLRESDKVGRFERGYSAMKQLDHPNVIKVYEYSEVPLGFFMEFIDGPNFRQLNPATAFDEAAIVQLLLRIAETLQHAHGRGVLHRDVKPENILIRYEESGEVSPFLTDFDLAWFSTATQLTKAADGFGSHFYAAPEQMNNPSSPAAHRPTVDSYSFGQVLFYGVGGRDPGAFDQEGNLTALRQTLSNKWTNRTAAQLIYDLYQSCTLRDPAKREGDFRVISNQLSDIIGELRAVRESLTGNEFLLELRYLFTGLPGTESPKSTQHPGFIEFRSASQRTAISIRIKLETDTSLVLEATFIPGEAMMLVGNSAGEARIIANSRIENVLTQFFKAYEPKRTGAKSGAYQATVTFSNITKDKVGLTNSRELVARVIDCLERA